MRSKGCRYSSMTRLRSEVIAAESAGSPPTDPIDSQASDRVLVQRRLVNQVGLGREKRDELVAYRPTGGRDLDARQQPLEGRRKQLGGPAEMPIERGPRNL